MKTQCACFFDDNALDKNLGEKVRGDFPALAQSDAVYFDNGATTQKPQAVLNAVSDYYTRFCANAGRGAYDWANKANAEMEKTRKKVAAFINADADEVFFTGGATESSNLIAFGYGLNNLSDGDEIM